MQFRRVTSIGLCAAAAALQLPAAARADVTIEGVEDGDLRDRMETVLPDSDDPDNRVEGRRIANDAAERIGALLRSLGYYGADIQARAREDEDGDAEAVVAVETGPLFHVDALEYNVDGTDGADMAARPETGEDALLSVGDPLVADDVLAEEAAAVTRLRMGGFPDATPDERRVLVDHAREGADVTYNLDAGRRAVFGEVRIESDANIRRPWLRRLVPFEPGDPYAPSDMETLSTRISGTGAFETVSVRLEPTEPGDGVETRDVIAEIDLGDRHTIEVGAGYATSDGARLETEWNRRNMFGGAETLTITAIAATLERSLTTELRAPHFLRPNRTVLASFQGIQEETDAYDRLAVILGLGAEQPLSETITAGVGVALEQSRVEDRISGRRDLTLFNTYGELRYDDTGDLLDPRNGLRAGVRLEPGLATGDDDLAFVRGIASVSAYKQVSDEREIVLAARLRAGTIFGATAADLPADRRFYAGGGGSVRGYDYQSLGPRDANNDPLGGRSLLEAAFETRFKVRGNFGGAVFVDAGTTRRGSIPSFGETRVGAGAGVRYYTPFGPIRADVAVPLNPRQGDSSFQIYISLGQAF